MQRSSCGSLRIRAAVGEDFDESTYGTRIEQRAAVLAVLLLREAAQLRTRCLLRLHILAIDDLLDERRYERCHSALDVLCGKTRCRAPAHAPAAQPRATVRAHAQGRAATGEAVWLGGHDGFTKCEFGDFLDQFW